MREAFDLKRQIEKVNDPEVLKSALLELLDRVATLEERLQVVGERPATGENKLALIAQKRERLERIRHGLTEWDERMSKQYIVSAELQAVKDGLDVLAEAGDCNSVILEGEPGTGKTQWAYSEVGQELQEGKDVALIHVRVKDTMHAQDLLYSIDDVRRLNDAQAKAQFPESIREEAAIWKQKIIKGEVVPNTDAGYQAFKVRMDAVSDLGEAAKDLDYVNYVDLGPLGEAMYQSGKGKKVYLLIDEIEKGREDLMTGMLDEIENLTFTIGETGTVVRGNKKNLRIIITTNTEDSDKIPASFRRRSLYHYINYPDRADMARIVELNFPGIQKELLSYAISIFYQYHENSEIQKKPSTPELLSWIRVLAKDYTGKLPQKVPHRNVLLKYKEDQEVEIGGANIEAQEQIENREVALPRQVLKVLQGEPVYRLTDRLNSFDEQEFLSKFYVRLQDAGISFVTPQFEDREDYDERDDEDSRTVQECVGSFQVIIPGVEYLGDDYYVIPEDKIHLLNEVIAEKVTLLPAGQRFTQIEEKHKNLTKGKINIDGYERNAYMVEGGKMIFDKPYKS